MMELFITQAAAVGPLGKTLQEIWERILAGDAAYGHAHLPGGRDYFVAETFPESASKISEYSELFEESVKLLLGQLKIEKVVDIIFLGTAVGSLAEIENSIYTGNSVLLKQLDFSELKRIFIRHKICDAHTRFVAIPTGCCAGLQAIGLAKNIMSELNAKDGLIMSIDLA